MVRLKGLSFTGVCRKYVNFNSCMVRLKVENVQVDCTNLTTFQFLYGTIKRWGERQKKYDVSEFQFLYGTIKSNNSISNTNIYFPISIPIWYD